MITRGQMIAARAALVRSFMTGEPAPQAMLVLRAWLSENGFYHGGRQGYGYHLDYKSANRRKLLDAVRRKRK